MLSLRPSSAHRWMVCTASPQFIEDHKAELPPDTSVYADEGTLAHFWAAKALKWIKGKSRKTGRKLKFPNAEMAKHCVAYACLGPNPTDPRMGIEEEVPLFYDRRRKGTVDRWFIHKRTLYIRDFKYGAGVSVLAEDNEQLLIYAGSIWDQHKLNLEMIDSVRLEIYQPRAKDGQALRDFTYTKVEFLAQLVRIQMQVDMIDSGASHEFVPDEDHQCRFCPAKSLCKHYAGYALGSIPPVARPNLGKLIELPKVNGLSNKNLATLLLSRKPLLAWFEAAEKLAFHRLNSGVDIPGYKLVEGRTRKRWKDEDAATKALTLLFPKSKILEPKLITPTAAEKLINDAFRALPDKIRKKNHKTFLSLITKPEGTPTLVHESDKRDEFEVDVAKEFRDPCL